jgi:hypothetical protein
MIEECRELDRHVLARDAGRAAAIAALAAGEGAPWLEAGRVATARSPGRAAARAAIWPLRRFFDPRFAGVDTHVTTMHADLSARMDRAFGPWGSQSLAEIERSIKRLGELVAANGDGTAGDGGARAIGIAHALVAIGRLPAGARVLDASSPPSGLSTSLAALGYDVAVVASLPATAPPFAAVFAIDADAGSHDLGRFLAPGGTLIVSTQSYGGDPRAHLPGILGAAGESDVRMLRRVRDDIWEPVEGAPSGETVALVTATRHEAPTGNGGGDRHERVGVKPASDA